MRCRYKKSGSEFSSSSFNPCGIGEILTGDDSAFIHECDVWIFGGWFDMREAFKNHDIVPDNYNLHFAEPINEECRKRGYNP
jgi:hypothetical protein